MSRWWRRGRARREQAAIARARLAAVTGAGWLPPASAAGGGVSVAAGGGGARPAAGGAGGGLSGAGDVGGAELPAVASGGGGLSAEGGVGGGLPAASGAGWVPPAGPELIPVEGPTEVEMADAPLDEVDRAEPVARPRVGDWLRSEWGRTTSGMRLDPGRRAAVAAVLAALVAAAIAAIVTWRLRPVEEHVAVGPAPSAVSSLSPAPSAGRERIVVAVAGKVRRPGLVRLPVGSRVADAIDAAGGLSPGARLGLLNLAQPLADGQQVVVGLPQAAAPGDAVPPAPTDGGSSSGPINLNTATLEQLDTLPGVGPVTAQAIIDWREESGPFRSVDQLREVSGIGEVRFGQLADLVTV